MSPGDQILCLSGEYSKLMSFRIRGATSFIKGDFKDSGSLKIQTEDLRFYPLN